MMYAGLMFMVQNRFRCSVCCLCPICPSSATTILFPDGEKMYKNKNFVQINCVLLTYNYYQSFSLQNQCCVDVTGIVSEYIVQVMLLLLVKSINWLNLHESYAHGKERYKSWDIMEIGIKREDSFY